MMESTDDRLSQTFAALANATRRAILARLAEGEATVNELAEPFQMSLPAISKHIKVLERAGLITQGQKAQYRPCIIDVTPIQEVVKWTEQYRQIWEASFDRMDDYINQLNNNQPNHQSDNHQSDNHQSDNHQSDNHQSDNHQSDNHQSDNHQSDNKEQTNE